MILSYDIRVVGAATVDKALAGIEARIRQHNASVAQSVGSSPAQARVARAARMPGGAVAGAASGVVEQEKAAFAVAKLASREKQSALREEGRIRSANSNQQLRAVRDEEKERARALAHHDRMADKIANQRSSFAQSTFGNGANRAINTTKAVGMAGAAMLGVGGAGLAASAVAGATSLDALTRRTIIGAREGGTTSKYDPDLLRKKYEQTGTETGVAPEAIAQGTQAFVTKTGDLDTAVRNMKVFATVAQATGASVEDIASASADLSEKMGIKSVEDMAQALATLTFQGKKGAFELRDMAAYLPEISSVAATFGVKGIKGITDLGGLMQVAKQSTGTGAEAATSVQAMFKQLSQKSDKIQTGEAFGGNKVEVFQGNDPTKPMRDFNEILGDMIAASRGNMVQLNETMDIRGVRAINPLISTYQAASEKAGGGEKGVKAGRAAVMDKLHDAANVKGDFGEIQKDAAASMKGFGVQMDMLNTQLKLAVSNELMPVLKTIGPELNRLVPYVGQATRVFVDLVKFFLDHPFQSMFLLLGAQMLADFSKARIGELVKGFLDNAVRRIPIPGGAGGSVPGLGAGSSGSGSASGALAAEGQAMGATLGTTILSGITTGAAIGIPLAAAIYAGGVASYEAGEADMRRSGSNLNRVRDMTGDEGDAKNARDMVEEQRKKVLALKSDKQGWTGGVVDSALNGIGFSNSDAELKTQQAFLEEMEAKMRTLLDFQDATKQIQASAKDQKDAAALIHQASLRFGLAKPDPNPNRGNAPSPVKS